MKLPWSKPDEKSGASLIALAQLPGATWGNNDPAALIRDGFAGNAIVYRCARMIPARSEVWSDGDNWQFGHWLNGRSGLITVSEVVEDMAQLGGSAIDGSGVGGILEGFAIDGVTSLASALGPLTTAFEFELIESGGALEARQEGIAIAADLDLENSVEDSFQKTRVLLDKQPAAVSLNYVSSDGGYQQAVVEARDVDARTGVKLSYGLPLVLSETRALSLAERLLQQEASLDRASVSLPPGLAPHLEVLDRVALANETWIVTRIEEQGLERQVSLRPPKLTVERSQSLSFPNAQTSPARSAAPFAKFIDIPALDHIEAAPPYVAATADPWRRAMAVQVGASALEMSERGVVSSPAGIGRLQRDLAASPPEGWDEDSILELYMPGETLSSRTEAAILAGQNRLLIEHEAGWELLAWRDADLIGQDLWQLRGLWRGLLGTKIQAASEGACAILADARLASVRMMASDIGLEQVWQVGTGDPQVFTYWDVAERFD